MLTFLHFNNMHFRIWYLLKTLWISELKPPSVLVLPAMPLGLHPNVHYSILKAGEGRGESALGDVLGGGGDGHDTKCMHLHHPAILFSTLSWDDWSYHPPWLLPSIAYKSLFPPPTHPCLCLLGSSWGGEGWAPETYWLLFEIKIKILIFWKQNCVLLLKQAA